MGPTYVFLGLGGATRSPRCATRFSITSKSDYWIPPETSIWIVMRHDTRITRTMKNSLWAEQQYTGPNEDLVKYVFTRRRTRADLGNRDRRALASIRNKHLCVVDPEWRREFDPENVA